MGWPLRRLTLVIAKLPVEPLISLLRFRGSIARLIFEFLKGIERQQRVLSCQCVSSRKFDNFLI